MRAKKLFYATSNVGKMMSLRREFFGTNVEIRQVVLEIPEIRSEDVNEIAIEKAKHAYQVLDEPVLVSDTGFYIGSLRGFPATFVKFTLRTIGLKGILKLVEGKQRSCEFRECMAYFDGETENPRIFVSRVHGTLSTDVRGTMRPHLWSELGMIFIPQGSSKTLSEMDESEYLEWRKLFREATSSSRQFAKWFKDS